MFKEELIKFKTAKLAKEKGFDVKSTGLFANEWYEHDGKTYLKCTQSLLQKWLREKHGIFMEIETTFSNVDGEHDGFMIMIRKIDMHSIEPYDNFTSYEEALEHCLMKALNLVK